MSDTNKKRITIWMRPEDITRVEALYPADNCESRSEFIGKAVEFYCGYLQTKSSAGYLSETLLSTMKGGLDMTESRICRLLFKLAVEQGIAMHVIAAATEVDTGTLEQLRAKCVNDVKKTLGSVRFDRIYAFQKSLDWEGEDDA